jgi:hypothetical protein
VLYLGLLTQAPSLPAPVLRLSSALNALFRSSCTAAASFNCLFNSLSSCTTTFFFRRRTQIQHNRKSSPIAPADTIVAPTTVPAWVELTEVPLWAVLVWVLKTEEVLLCSEWLVPAVLRCEEELWVRLENALSSLIMLLTSGISLVLVPALSLAVSIPPALLSVLVPVKCDSVIVTVVV